MSVPRRFTGEETVTFIFRPVLRAGWPFWVFDVPQLLLLVVLVATRPAWSIPWESHDRLWVFLAVLFGLAIIILGVLLLTRMNGGPCWTLRVGERTIVRMFTGLWNREWTLNAVRAQFRPVRFGFWNRCFTFSAMKSLAEYHIEIESDGKTLLFPCRDEEEQKTWLGMIASFRKSAGDNND